MQENIDYKKHGDAAFRAKDYETAIEFYTEVSLYIIKKPSLSPQKIIHYL